MKATGWLIALCLLGAPQSSPGQAPAAPRPPLTAEQQMDKLFDFWNRLDQPGFAVVVVKDGRVLYQKVFGLACQEHAVAITPNSVFNASAAAQPFVGQAIAMLEKQGRLSLDDEVRKYIPDMPDYGAPLRVRHLLFHSSGLRDWVPVLRLTGGDAEEITFDRVMKIVTAQKKLECVPGGRAQFSSTNYDVLAEVVKRITGKPYSEWAWENVFKPLKMTRTAYRDNSRSIFDNEALSYNFTRQEYLRSRDTLSLAGSHCLFTTIADLSKWLVALQTPGATGLPGADVLEKMFLAGRLDDGTSAGFGYGVRLDTESGRRRAVVSGTWAGSGIDLAYYPEERFGYAVLANWDYTSVAGFGPEIVRIYLPVPARPSPKPPAATATVSQAALDRYSGNYRLGPGQVFNLVNTGGRLFLQFAGQRMALTSLSETEFLLDLASVRMTFRPTKDGKDVELLWNDGSADRVAPKVVLVTPSPEDLKAYAGSYVNEELDYAVRIEARGGQLVMVRPAGETRLASEVKDLFTSPFPPVPAIAFQRDAQGRVTGFSIDSDALRNLVFRRE